MSLPKPHVRKIRWPVYLIWLVPLGAIVAAGYFYHDRMQDRGPTITIKFTDGTGLNAGQTLVSHRGVMVGKVMSVELSDDKQQVLAQVQLRKSDDAFAKTGAMFWIVKPEISTESISGLSTVVSGPYVEAIPGNGEAMTEFTALDKAPAAQGEGLRLVLHTDHLSHLQSESPVFFRGFEVGTIESVKLNSDATQIDVHLFIRKRYAGLVKSTTQFWIESGADVKGGIFSGLQLKVDSLRALIAGGVSFATPDDPKSQPVQDGAEFSLHDEPKKDWLTWSPKLPVGPEESNKLDDKAGEKNDQDALKSAIKGK